MVLQRHIRTIPRIFWRKIISLFIALPGWRPVYLLHQKPGMQSIASRKILAPSCSISRGTRRWLPSHMPRAIWVHIHRKGYSSGQSCPYTCICRQTRGGEMEEFKSADRCCHRGTRRILNSCWRRPSFCVKGTDHEAGIFPVVIVQKREFPLRLYGLQRLLTDIHEPESG